MVKLRVLILSYSEMKNKPATDNEYSRLSNSISEYTNTTPIHINTLKRIFDHWAKAINYCYSSQTKQIIANFLDKETWDELIQDIDDMYNDVLNGIKRSRVYSQIETSSYENIMHTLKPGDLMSVMYSPDKVVKLEAIGNGRYKVISAVNSFLLQPFDEISLPILRKGIPFMASRIIRNNECVGDYTSANGHVITEVTFQKKKQ